MADLVKYTLDDGTDVYFESAEGEGLVSQRGGKPTVEDGGPIANRLEPVAKAAGVVSRSLRSELRPDEITVEFGVKVSGEVNWWFFSRTKAEGTITVTLKWAGTTGDAERGEGGEADG